MLGEPVVLTVGRLERYKNVDLIIDAFRALPYSAVLVVVGDGPDRGRLERHAEASEPGWPVVFTGRISDSMLDRLFAQANVVTSASDHEAFGLSPRGGAGLGGSGSGFRHPGTCRTRPPCGRGRSGRSRRPAGYQAVHGVARGGSARRSNSRAETSSCLRGLKWSQKPVSCIRGYPCRATWPTERAGLTCPKSSSSPRAVAPAAMRSQLDSRSTIPAPVGPNVASAAARSSLTGSSLPANPQFNRSTCWPWPYACELAGMAAVVRGIHDRPDDDLVTRRNSHGSGLGMFS